jgi:hypothetical protein
MQFVQQLLLASPKRGVVYVCNYKAKEAIAEALRYAFYNAQANNKEKVLQE